MASPGKPLIQSAGPEKPCRPKVFREGGHRVRKPSPDAASRSAAGLSVKPGGHE